MTSNNNSDEAVVICYSEFTKEDELLVEKVVMNSLKMQECEEKAQQNKFVAQAIKLELDSQKGGSWNVVVGKSFGSMVTHETKTMIQLFVGNVAILIWRYG